jgi:pyruvate dehydrogenase E2 component (dihydrolipoamide acetyltransferase)
VGKEIQVRLPDIGDFSSVDVIEVLVGPGDQVKAEDSLITLESDKATMEIPSPHSGRVKSLQVKVGDKLAEGDPILTLEPAEEESDAEAVPGLQPGTDEAEADQTRAQSETSAEGLEVSQAPALVPRPEQAERRPGDKAPLRPPVTPRPADMRAIATGRKPHASPSVRRFARELGVDLTLVQGSGSKGRILKDDVQGFVKKTLSGTVAPTPAGGGLQLPSIPEVDFAKFGKVEEQSVPRIKKISGAHLHRCWLNVPHVTQFDEADITELDAFRKDQKAAGEAEGVKLTLFPFLLKACAAALREMPEFNSSLSADGERLIYRKYIHIGVAVDTPNGLMVPVVRDVETKGVLQLAAELGEVSQRARDGKLSPGDMQGGCFSISSLGGIGGTAFTPIVNAPEVAILGVSRSAMKPVWTGSTFEPRLVLPLSLSYDHRVIDGAQGVRFTTYLVGLLGDIRRLLL